MRPPSWIKPFLPQQGFSTAQVLVTRVGKNLKNPKESEPTAPLYPILQRGTEELLFPPPYQSPEPPQAPTIPSPRNKTQGGGGWGPHKILAIREPGPQRGRQTQPLPFPYEWPAPSMRQETNLINTGPFLLVTYITGNPKMLSSQTTLEL